MVKTKTNKKKGEVITSARFPIETRNKLIILSRIKNMSISDVMIESVERFYAQEEDGIDSYTLGIPYFGKYGSGIGDLSTTYKQRIYKDLRERQNSY